MNNKANDNFNYESIEEGYYDNIFKKHKGAQSKWHHQKFAAVRSLFPYYQNHLDIGCGPGTFIGTLHPQRTSLGIDISESQIAYAKKHYGTKFHSFQRIQPGTKLPFSDNTFDLVTSVELIEHITLEDGKFLLNEARRVLRPGGTLIITTPNYGSGWPMLEKMVNAFSKLSYQDQHIQHYKKKSLYELLETTAFTDIRVESMLFLSPFWAGLHWRLADTIYNLEKRSFAKMFGFLLIAEAKKG